MRMWAIKCVLRVKNVLHNDLNRKNTQKAGYVSSFDITFI